MPKMINEKKIFLKAPADLLMYKHWLVDKIRILILLPVFYGFKTMLAQYFMLKFRASAVVLPAAFFITFKLKRIWLSLKL